jgi:hypothetical protein
MVLRRAAPPPATLLRDQHCVWDCLAGTLGLPASLLHACWVATLPVGSRWAWLDGRVPHADLPRVLAHFGVGATVRHGTSHALRCPRAPGAPNDAVTFDPRQPPLFVLPPQPCGIADTYYLAFLPGGVRYHLTATASATHNTPMVSMARPGSVIGYVSRQLSALELGSICNVPVRTFMRSWLRFDGQIPSAAAVSENLASTGLPAAVNMPMVPVSRQTVRYTLDAGDVDLACHLAQDLKNHPEALDLREYKVADITRGWHALAKSKRREILAGHAPRPVNLHLFHGAPGTGKTFAMMQYLQAAHAAAPFDVSNLRLHCWLNALRGPLEAATTAFFPFLQSFNFQTGAMPLVQPLPGTLVLDDATQLWPGFIPLLLATNPGLTDIVITFDASQSRTAFPHADALTRADASTAEWLSAMSDRYATESHRLSADNSALFGLPAPALTPGAAPLDGKLYLTSNVVPDLPLLVVSPRFATSQAEGGQRCMTFRECQGFTIDGDVSIDLGGLSATATDNAWWTALTRARGNICLFMGPLSQGPGLNEPHFGRSNIASAILAVAAQQSAGMLDARRDPLQLVARAVQAHLSRCLSPAAAATLGLAAPAPTVGWRSDPEVRSEWLAAPRDGFLGDFWTARSQAALRQGHRSAASPAFSRHAPSPVAPPHPDVAYALRHYAVLPNDAVLTVEPSGYVAPSPPLLTCAPDPALNFDTFVDSERRERVVLANTLSTAQHVHDGPNAILHHSRRDKLTASWSESKRIRVGVDHGDLSPRERARVRQLQAGFKKFFDVAAWNRVGWNHADFERAGREAYAPWVSKRTRAGIDRSIAKNPIDSPLNFAHLFLKGQYVKKEPSRFAPAKAGQTVSEFNLVRQFRDAPFAIYMERLALRFAFPTTYLHCRASPSQMDDWYTSHWRPGPMTANDYTAWDSGCDRVFLEFDVWLMGLSGIPVEYIAKYRAERLTTHSYLGPHMVRQESGDRWTWLLNTLRDAAITGASLRCPRATPAAFSGDDSVVLGHWLPAHGFLAREWPMSPKLEFGTHLVFCGYTFGSTHISLSPDVVLHRAQYGLALGRNDPDYWRSIADGIAEAGVSSPDHSPTLSTARGLLVSASIRYGFPSLKPLVFR